MPDGHIHVGQVEVVGLSDATLDYPWSLEELFPDATAAAWDEYRQRFPESFGGPSVYRSDYTCYLLRTPGRTLLVDTAWAQQVHPWRVSSAAPVDSWTNSRRLASAPRTSRP